MNSKLVAVILTCVALAVGQPFSVRAQNLVQNGSLEDLNNGFVNTAVNYMSLFAGSATIADWTVTAATENEIAWAQSPTGDGYTAADGIFFVDLTGFGGDSPNGGLQQTLHHLINGDTYQFSIDAFGNLPIVTVGTASVSLSAGTPFGFWTPETGSFTADGSDPLLTISNPGGGEIGFIDNIIVTGPSSAVPDRGSLLPLWTALLGGFGLVQRRLAKTHVR